MLIKKVCIVSWILMKSHINWNLKDLIGEKNLVGQGGPLSTKIDF